MGVAALARSDNLTRIALGTAVAGFATSAFTGYVWWSARGGAPTPDMSAVILIAIAIGAAAGLISGRLLAAPVSWLAAVFGSSIGYQLAYGDPALPAQHSSFTGHVLLNFAFLMLFVGAGHLLGAWLRNTDVRGRAGAAIAGLAACGSSGLGLWQLRLGEPSADIAQIAMWFLLVAWVLGGATAGYVSGRGRDALASWAASVIGFMFAFLAVFGISDGAAAPVETLAYTPIALLPFIAGGHLMGAAIASRRRSATRGEA